MPESTGSIRLTETQKKAVRDLLKRLRYRQNRLAKQVGCVPSTISDTISLDKNKAIGGELWQKVVDLIRGEYQIALTAGRVTAAEGQLLADVESSFYNTDTEPPLNIQPPFGALRANADNYIVRQAEEDFKKFIENPTLVPMVMLEGGVQYGKSSFLQRFIRNVQTQQGEHYRIYFADFANLISPLDSDPPIKSVSDCFKVLFNDLWELPIDIENINNDTIDSYQSWLKKFKDWAKTNKDVTDAQHIFLIVDALETIHLNESIKEADSIIGNLLRFFTSIRNEPEPLEFKKMTTITTITGRSYSAAVASAYDKQSWKLQLKPFSDAEVQKLLKLFRLKEDDATDIYEFFHGQPHLTHLAVYELAQGASWVEVKKRAENLEGSYLTHWQQMLINLKATTGHEQPKLLELIKGCKKVPEPDFDKTTELCQLGLIYMDKENYQLPQFYESAIKSSRTNNFFEHPGAKEKTPEL